MKKITLIVDVSGSMTGEAQDATKGIREIAQNNPEARFNLIEFGRAGITKVKVIFENKKPKKLLDYTLRAQSNTPLWDGIGEGLSLIDPAEDNFIVIVTDGGENASREWQSKHIKPLIGALEAAKVEFLFIGADVTSIEDLKGAGFRDSRIFSSDNVRASYMMADQSISASYNTALTELDDSLAKIADTIKDVKAKKQ